MLKFVDPVLKRLLSAKRYGGYLFRRYPAQGRGWGGPLNGQKWRCLIVAELIQKLEPKAIVETGTYLGTTTDWLAAFQTPVYSCEASAQNFGFSQTRFIGVANVNILQSDSRTALRHFLAGPLAKWHDETILFYLDAHWNADLPLAEEIRIIFDTCPRAAVLIDDFQVPGDSGYGYDNYGPGMALVHEYVAPAMAHYGLDIWYPVMASELETGAKRGCALLTGLPHKSTMETISLLEARSIMGNAS